MTIVHEEDEVAECGICCNLKRDAPQWQLDSCGHTFCHDCLRAMLAVTPDANCPLCRKVLTDVDEILADDGAAPREGGPIWDSPQPEQPSTEQPSAGQSSTEQPYPREGYTDLGDRPVLRESVQGAARIRYASPSRRTSAPNPRNGLARDPPALEPPRGYVSPFEDHYEDQYLNPNLLVAAMSKHPDPVTQRMLRTYGGFMLQLPPQERPSLEARREIFRLVLYGAPGFYSVEEIDFEVLRRGSEAVAWTPPSGPPPDSPRPARQAHNQRRRSPSPRARNPPPRHGHRQRRTSPPPKEQIRAARPSASRKQSEQGRSSLPKERFEPLPQTRQPPSRQPSHSSSASPPTTRNTPALRQAPRAPSPAPSYPKPVSPPTTRDVPAPRQAPRAPSPAPSAWSSSGTESDPEFARQMREAFAQSEQLSMQDEEAEYQRILELSHREAAVTNKHNEEAELQAAIAQSQEQSERDEEAEFQRILEHSKKDAGPYNTEDDYSHILEMSKREYESQHGSQDDIAHILEMSRREYESQHESMLEDMTKLAIERSWQDEDDPSRMDPDVKRAIEESRRDFRQTARARQETGGNGQDTSAGPSNSRTDTRSGWNGQDSRDGPSRSRTDARSGWNEENLRDGPSSSGNDAKSGRRHRKHRDF